MEFNKQIPIGTAEDLTNQQFGQLIVLYRVQNLGTTRGAKWRCQCSCGNETEVLASNLKRGHTLSCGCMQKAKVKESHFIDETGKKYGRLTVLERGEDYISPAGYHSLTWKCKCDCGNIITTHASALRSGKTTSCGCFRLEQVSNRVNEKYIGKSFHHITVLSKMQEPKEAKEESRWKCKCNLCNRELILTTGRLNTQISCGCLQDSYGVSVIKTLLQNNNIVFETEKVFDDCIFEHSGKKARFDFYINNEYIIEFDGQQHFSYSAGWNTKENLLQTQMRDEIKNKWCQEHNIPLIRIPYWAADSLTIEDLLPTSRFLYKNNTGGTLEDEN